MRLYLDEDVDPLLAKLLCQRGFDCISTRDAKNLHATDPAQLAFAAREDRAILTFNVRDYVKLARAYAESGKHHSGIILSQPLPFRDLLRRTAGFLQARGESDPTDQVLWLQDVEPDL